MGCASSKDRRRGSGADGEFLRRRRAAMRSRLGPRNSFSHDDDTAAAKERDPSIGNPLDSEQGGDENEERVEVIPPQESAPSVTPVEHRNGDGSQVLEPATTGALSGKSTSASSTTESTAGGEVEASFIVGPGRRLSGDNLVPAFISFPPLPSGRVSSSNLLMSSHGNLLMNSQANSSYRLSPSSSRASSQPYSPRGGEGQGYSATSSSMQTSGSETVAQLKQGTASFSQLSIYSPPPLGTFLEVNKRYRGGYTDHNGDFLLHFLSPSQRRDAMHTELAVYRAEVHRGQRGTTKNTYEEEEEVLTSCALLTPEHLKKGNPIIARLQNAIKGEGMLWAHPSFYDGLPMPLTAFSAEDESTMNQAPSLFPVVRESGQAYQQIWRDLPSILLTFSRGDFPATMSLLEGSSNSVSTAGLRCSERVKVCLVQLEACIRDYAVLVWNPAVFKKALRRQDFDSLMEYRREEVQRQSLLVQGIGQNVIVNESSNERPEVGEWLSAWLCERVEYVCATLSVVVAAHLHRERQDL